MEWTINDKNCATRIVESQSLIDLKDWMITKGCKCKVILDSCDPDFWLTKDEKLRCSNMGPMGNVGFRSAEEAERWKG